MSEKFKFVINRPAEELTTEETVFACTGLSIDELVEDMQLNPKKYEDCFV